MRWDIVLHIAGIAGLLGAYALYVHAGQSPTVLFAVLASIVALISPEVLDALPYGPDK